MSARKSATKPTPCAELIGVKPFYERAGVRLYHGDALEIAPRLPRPTSSIVVQDPPYSADVHQSVRSGARARGGNVRRAVDLGFGHLTPALRRGLAAQAARLATRWVITFSDVESTWLWRMSLEAAGLQYVRQGTWVKIGAAPQFSGDRPAIGVEALVIAHATNGGRPIKKRWNGGGRPAVYHVPIVLSRGRRADQRHHKAQKPEELMIRILRHFADLKAPGETVYDMTAGVGTTGVAAARLGLGFVGVELDRANCEIAARRIDDELDARARGEARIIDFPDRRPARTRAA